MPGLSNELLMSMDHRKVVLKLMFREFDIFSTDVSYRSRFKMQNSKNFSPSC